MSLPWPELTKLWEAIAMTTSRTFRLMKRTEIGAFTRTFSASPRTSPGSLPSAPQILSLGMSRQMDYNDKDQKDHPHDLTISVFEASFDIYEIGTL